MDKRLHAKQNQIEVNDRILVKQPKTNKLTPNFNPQPYIVSEKNGTKITATNESTGHTISRNTSHFKQVPETASAPPTIVEEEDEGYDEHTACQNKPTMTQRKVYPKRNRIPPEFWRK